MSVQVLTLTSFGWVPRHEPGGIVFTFIRSHRLFFTVLTPFYFPVSDVVPSYDSGGPSGCEVASHGGFSLHFPDDW